MGSPPLSFRSLAKWTEGVGEWQAMICVVTGVYDAANLGWMVRYTYFSTTEAWGNDANAFFFEDYLQMAETPAMDFTIVPGVFWPMLAVWIAVLVVLGMGVRRGIGMASAIGIPILVVMFL